MKVGRTGKMRIKVKKGALHRQLGIPAKKKIPVSTLNRLKKVDRLIEKLEALRVKERELRRRRAWNAHNRLFPSTPRLPDLPEE